MAALTCWCVAGMGNHGNCAAPQEIVGLQGPELQVAAGMYHALAVGCVNLVRNKLRKIESTYSLAWQQSAQLMRQEAEFHSTVDRGKDACTILEVKQADQRTRLD